VDALHAWTVGHSTRSGEAFVALLQAQAIEAIADVRRFPGSRRHPQFGQEALEESLAADGIAYHWIPQLGGRRRLQHPPATTAWRNPSFAAYAQYLETEDFAQGLTQLLAMAGGLRTAMMCSELLWWRCHRALIADALVASGIVVTHILGEREARPHVLRPPARIVDGELVYLPEDDLRGS
jgi:uncharacterized protein (DUF488 family)